MGMPTSVSFGANVEAEAVSEITIS